MAGRADFDAAPENSAGWCAPRLEKRRKRAQLQPMKQHRLAESPKWTRAEDYVEALARRRTARRASDSRQRTQPEAPRLLLSTVPFLVLFGLLAALSIAITIVAMPGSQPRPAVRQAASTQEGIAARGWLEEAKKDFHR